MDDHEDKMDARAKLPSPVMDDNSVKMNAQELRKKVLENADLQNVTQTAKIFLGDDDPRYWQEAFPILVASKHSAEKKFALVCTAFETLLQFQSEVQKTLGHTPSRPLSFNVCWNSNQKGCQLLNDENLYAILKMVQARPGKDIFLIE